MTTSDKAGRWLRVSTGGQDEANQLPDIDAWCDSHGYEVAATYTVHGKSAYHGKQAKDLDAMFADMAAGRINVLVVWVSDRIERRGALATLTLAERARQAGGRIEYVKEPHLNTSNDMSDTMLALAGDMARMESKRKSDRTIAEQAKLRRADSVIGRAPYGFRNLCEVCQTPAQRPACNGHRKVMVPIPAEASVIQDAASWYMDGMTLDEICDKLNVDGRLPRMVKSSGVQPKWVAKTLSGCLRNPAIVGRRKNGEGWTVKPEAILDRATYDAVVARMAQRATRAGISQTRTPAMLTSVIKCGIHGRNAYRTGSGYYCRVKGCKTWIALAVADSFVHDSMSELVCRDMVEVVTPGGNHDEEIAEVKRDMQDAIQAEDFARLADLKTELDRLRSLPAKPASVERRESDKTVAEMWAALEDDTARRAFLLERKATVVVKYAEDGKSRRLVFDGPWVRVNQGG